MNEGRPPTSFHVGDKVTVVDGTFLGQEGTISGVERYARYGLIRVMLTVFDQPVAVELEPFQVKHAPREP
jgi:transcription antitermination factor NusG